MIVPPVTPLACRTRSLTAPSACRAPAAGPLLPFAERFCSLGRLGEGSHGVVYLCSDRLSPRGYVVVKVAHCEPRARITVADEVEALRDLQGACGVPDVKTLLYQKEMLSGFVTPYRAGETMDRLLRHHRPAGGALLTLSASIADAVLAVLSRGYIHRDLKPENLLCTRDGRVQVLDFGLARRCSGNVPGGELSGTLAYASPEQIEGRSLDARSDLFSLGVVLYELATADMFFPRETTRLSAFLAARKRRMGEPIRLDGVDGRLAALIRRLLIESPSGRAGTREVAVRVRGFAPGVPLPAAFQ